MKSWESNCARSKLSSAEGKDFRLRSVVTSLRGDRRGKFADLGWILSHAFQTGPKKEVVARKGEDWAYQKIFVFKDRKSRRGNGESERASCSG